MRIAVASNHVGFNAKMGIVAQLRQLGHEAFDLGPANDEVCDYPDFAATAARAIASGQVERAILIGGTGIGMSIAANKFRGVRAALCHDDLSAEMSRRYNNANVLCLSVDLLGEEPASRMIEVWLSTPFEEGHHSRRIAKIAEIERQIWDAGKTVSVASDANIPCREEQENLKHHSVPNSADVVRS